MASGGGGDGAAAGGDDVATAGEVDAVRTAWVSKDWTGMVRLVDRRATVVRRCLIGMAPMAVRSLG